jgi:predicted transposase YbfD/YdcC
MMSNVNADIVEQVLLEWQQRIRGPVPEQEIVVIDGKLVSLDALHSCQQTARQIVLDAGADYALTIKDNCSVIRKRIESKLPHPGFPLLPRKTI